MTEYDLWTIERARLMLDHLKSRPTFRWWNRFVFHPKPIWDAPGPFLGWSSFYWRNQAHEVSMEIKREFRRIYGREMCVSDT